ncbi:MAG: hypothetical protein PHT94_00650 [Candidatus Nanoarchaeia archaeon]|nr:hypothetical protein [Candidatus Nanoarchaeia archaeon]
MPSSSSYQILEDSYYYHDWLQEVEDNETIFSFLEWMEFYYPGINTSYLISEKMTYAI